MMASDKCPTEKSPPALGFLTVLDHENDGLFGGYLILNVAGRPLEFHCTAPIRPNRAQEILYGPTLEPYLYGEQIGQTLLDKATLAPLLVCTDRAAAMAVREFIETPVALVVPPDRATTDDSNRPGEATSDNKCWRVDSAHSGAPCLSHFQLGANHLAVAQRSVADHDVIVQRLCGIADSLDLAEPFQRIREAIEEARDGGPQP